MKVCWTSRTWAQFHMLGRKDFERLQSKISLESHVERKE